MNEKSDKPAKQSAEPDQSAAQDQPQYREVSQEELKQILEAHQKWLEFDGKQGKQADLGEANLQKADLFQANLQKANLGDANLQKADLLRANLQGANLERADLREADLLSAALQGANLSFANLQKADLSFANLQKANLSFANLQGADLFEVEAVTASQIKEARNWQLAFYSDDLREKLGLPTDHNGTVKKKLAEMEQEKEKTATKP